MSVCNATATPPSASKRARSARSCSAESAVSAEVGYGYTGKHPLQETVEQFLKVAGVYIASVSAEAAFNPAEADLGRIYLAAATTWPMRRRRT